MHHQKVSSKNIKTLGIFDDMIVWHVLQRIHFYLKESNISTVIHFALTIISEFYLI